MLNMYVDLVSAYSSNTAIMSISRITSDSSSSSLISAVYRGQTMIKTHRP